MWERSLLKTLWEKEKLLVQAISPFPTMFSTLSKTEIIIFVTFVICKCFQIGLVQNCVVWEWVKPLPQCCVLMHQRYMAVENIVRKKEIACNKRLLLFLQCFLPYMALTFHFKCTLKCCLQFVSVWASLKFCLLVMGYQMTNL